MNELAKVLLEVYEENVIDKGYVEEKRQELEKASKYDVWHLAARLNDDALQNFAELLAKRFENKDIYTQDKALPDEIMKSIKMWRYIDFNIDLTSRPKTRLKMV